MMASQAPTLREDVLSNVRRMHLGDLAGAALLHLVHEATDSLSRLAIQIDAGKYVFSSAELLNHSISVAFGAAQLAAGLGLETPPHLFAASLLHDVGKAVLDTIAEVNSGEINAMSLREHIPLHEAERRILGSDHAEVGAIFLESWHLDDRVLEAVRWHHQPSCASKDNGVVDLLHVSDALSLMASAPSNAGYSHLPSKDALRRLGLNTPEAGGLICKTLGRLDELQELLGHSRTFQMRKAM